jgi:hypothetical protein
MQNQSLLHMPIESEMEVRWKRWNTVQQKHQCVCKTNKSGMSTRCLMCTLIDCWVVCLAAWQLVHFHSCCIVTGLVIFGPLDRLMDGFSCSDGLEWDQDGLDKPIIPFPTVENVSRGTGTCDSANRIPTLPISSDCDLSQTTASWIEVKH